MSSSLQPHVTTPTHWDATWAHVWVHRATEDQARRAAVALPRNLSRDATPAQRAFAEMYWQGAMGSWDQLLTTVTDEALDVALLPWRSDLVILDCDVKEYQVDTGFVVTDGVARLAPTTWRYGVEDLAREVRSLGHDPRELATYTVRTKSGGVHLYYRAHPDLPLDTRHHRHDWRVDVIAGTNTWVAAPPTPGYYVVRDLPVAPLPTWLAEFLRDLATYLPPIGRQHSAALEETAKTARRDALEAVTRRDAGKIRADDTDLLTQYVQLELDRIALANQHGGWNQAIYDAARNLLEVGWSLEAVTPAVLTAAAPVDARNQRQALDTLRSAWRGHTTSRATRWDDLQVAVGAIGEGE